MELVRTQPWLWPNLLSLDAPLVAVLWQILFARCFHASVDIFAAVLLVLSVWLIYAADRVLDGRKESSGLPRHEFYRRHWKRVAPVWGLVLGVAGWLAWTRLPVALFQRGAGLIVVVGCYFLAVHALPRGLRFAKEGAVAVLFAMGASVAAWGRVRSAADVGTILLFSCLCWINCAAIERWEHRTSTRPIGKAALLVAAAALILLTSHRPVLSAAETASALAFVMLDQGRDRLSRDALRVLADVALMSPVFFLPIAGMLA